MKPLLRNCLFQNKNFIITVLYLLFAREVKCQQIGNYVNNGSFEDYYISGVIYKILYNWSAVDSLKPYGILLAAPSDVPLNSYAYQVPKDGKNYLGSTIYCSTCSANRSYPKNRLKYVLETGKKYCVSMYVNLTNQSTYGIDAIGIYFSDASLDTIKKCNNPITYLMPQVENPINNILLDTMNWVPINRNICCKCYRKIHADRRF